jgi:hypothetical protein
MTYLRRNRDSALAGLALAVSLFASVIGCGAAETIDYPGPAQEPEVAFEAQLCPAFVSHLVIPANLHSGDAAFVFVRAASTPDDESLDYAWRATSGTFSYPRRAITEYRCTGRGPQLLTVTASDSTGCTTELELPVDCLE